MFLAQPAIRVSFEHPRTFVIHLDNNILPQQASVPSFTGFDLVYIPNCLPVIQGNGV